MVNGQFPANLAHRRIREDQARHRADGQFVLHRHQPRLYQLAGSGSGNLYDKIACDATNGDPFDQAAKLCTGMKAKGVKPYFQINHGMTLSAYFRDPDGNQVETQVDTLTLEEAEREVRGVVDDLGGTDRRERADGLDTQPQVGVGVARQPEGIPGASD